MTRQEQISARVDKIVARILKHNLNWKATVNGVNKIQYNIEVANQAEFEALLIPAITEIVDFELAQ